MLQVKIENQKLDWNVTAKVRVKHSSNKLCSGALQNLSGQAHILFIKHVSTKPYSGSVQTPPTGQAHILFKVGSTVNMRHQAGGGDVKVKKWQTHLVH